jgi:hypothetical protein
LTEVRQSVFWRSREGSKDDGIDAMIVDDNGEPIQRVAGEGRCPLAPFNLAGFSEGVDDCLGYNFSFINDNYSGHHYCSKA